MTPSPYTGPGEGTELVAPDAVVTVKVAAAQTTGAYEVFEIHAPRVPATPLHRTNWAKTYYVLSGRMLVHLEDEAYDLGPGAAVVIQPNAWHTFTVLSPSTTFLVVSLTDAMGRFHADLDATVPHGAPLSDSVDALAQVLSRHDVALKSPELGP
ncbi:MAG: cupin domain-containing protein [Actinomycetes bacterium]